MTGTWQFETRRGVFRIAPRGGGFVLSFEGENLGRYPTPMGALDDLVGGHCDWPSTWDPSLLGIPDELSEWTFVPG